MMWEPAPADQMRHWFEEFFVFTRKYEYSPDIDSLAGQIVLLEGKWIIDTASNLTGPDRSLISMLQFKIHNSKSAREEHSRNPLSAKRAPVEFFGDRNFSRYPFRNVRFINRKRLPITPDLNGLLLLINIFHARRTCCQCVSHCWQTAKKEATKDNQPTPLKPTVRLFSFFRFARRILSIFASPLCASLDHSLSLLVAITK